MTKAHTLVTSALTLSALALGSTASAAPYYKYIDRDKGIYVLDDVPEGTTVCRFAHMSCAGKKDLIVETFQMPWTRTSRTQVPSNQPQKVFVDRYVLNRRTFVAELQNGAPLRPQGHMMPITAAPPRGSHDPVGWFQIQFQRGSRGRKNHLVACKFRNKNGQRAIVAELSAPGGFARFPVPQGNFTVVYTQPEAMRVVSRGGLGRITFRPASGTGKKLVMLERCNYIGYN